MSFVCDRCRQLISCSLRSIPTATRDSSLYFGLLSSTPPAIALVPATVRTIGPSEHSTDARLLISFDFLSFALPFWCHGTSVPVFLSDCFTTKFKRCQIKKDIARKRFELPPRSFYKLAVLLQNLQKRTIYNQKNVQAILHRIFQAVFKFTQHPQLRAQIIHENKDHV